MKCVKLASDCFLAELVKRLRRNKRRKVADFIFFIGNALTYQMHSCRKTMSVAQT